MISVITVCFNAYKEIEKTIKSVLEQKSKAYEYIFVDGASKDGTLDVINKYIPEFHKKGITVKVVSEPDKGIYDAMNKGAKKAQGNWINFLNAGDCYHDENVLQVIESYLDDNKADIVVGEIVYLEGYLGRRYRHKELNSITEEMIFCHQAIFANRKLFVEKLFNVEYRYSADYDWILYMYLKQYRILCIDAIVADYDSEGLSYQNRVKTLAEKENIRIAQGVCTTLQTEDAKISWRYKVYKIIATNKLLALIYYKMVSKRKPDVYWNNQ